MELSEIRKEIDQINQEMQRLFERRMDLCGQVAEYKGAHGMEIFAPAREEEILQAVRSRAIPSMQEYDVAFFENLMSLSRKYQAALLGIDPNSPAVLPQRFETARLQLRPLRREDLPPVYSLTSDPEVARYLRFSAHTDPSQTLELIDALTAQGNHGFLVMTRPAGIFAGVFALKSDRNDATIADITLFLNKQFWNRGFAGELLEFARKEAPKMGFHSLQAWTADGNIPSRKALEKAGFTFQQRFTLRGMEHGVSIYQLLLDA